MARKRKTRSVIRLVTSPEDHRIAQLAAAAIGLALIDAAIPLPLPGVKPGLANIVTLIVLARFGWATAAWVSGLRVVAGSLLLGQFMSPGFFMSLTGSLFSLFVLAFAVRLPGRWRRRRRSEPCRRPAGRCCRRGAGVGGVFARGDAPARTQAQVFHVLHPPARGFKLLVDQQAGLLFWRHARKGE